MNAGLRMPYDQTLGALLHEPSFQNLLPQAVYQKTRVIQKVGNQAVHGARPIQESDALQADGHLPCGRAAAGRMGEAGPVSRGPDIPCEAGRGCLQDASA